MRIGLDFDNTIVSYDALFHKVAREKDLVPPDIPANKVAVRDYLRRIGREEAWTEMQGYVYGTRLDEALVYTGMIEFLRWTGQVGHDLAIVSHKTRHPFLGPKYDLHAAARGWVERHLCADGSALVPADKVFFELTKEEKLARIGTIGCDVFIDDLPEILQADGFPATTRRVLFDPECHHTAASLPGVTVLQSWDGIAQYLRS